MTYPPRPIHIIPEPPSSHALMAAPRATSSTRCRSWRSWPKSRRDRGHWLPAVQRGCSMGRENSNIGRSCHHSFRSFHVFWVVHQDDFTSFAGTHGCADGHHAGLQVPLTDLLEIGQSQLPLRTCHRSSDRCATPRTPYETCELRWVKSIVWWLRPTNPIDVAHCQAGMDRWWGERFRFCGQETIEILHIEILSWMILNASAVKFSWHDCFTLIQWLSWKWFPWNIIMFFKVVQVSGKRNKWNSSHW